MKMMKKITMDTMSEFSDKIEYGIKQFIPMLPFVKMPFHDFDKYKNYSDKGIYLIDYIDNEYCLYQLYHLNEGDDTLRVTLMLPSSWEHRFEIIEKSIPNLKEWFLTQDTSKYFIIQSLEYGEIEYYPTLSHYLIPTIIRNGFEPKYRMYMKRESENILNCSNSLKDGLRLMSYSNEIYDEVCNFYFKGKDNRNERYFTNCTYDEFHSMLQDGFTRKHSKFVLNPQNKIVSGILVSKDSDKTWIDNFTVDTEYDNEGSVGEYLLYETLKQLVMNEPEESIYIYLNRDCNGAVNACEKNGFIPFEFWTDMILER